MKRDELIEGLQELYQARLAKEGIRMSKQISSGGLFGYATYDNRTVHEEEDLDKLVKEGFSLDEDAGVFLLNMIRTSKIAEKENE